MVRIKHRYLLFNILYPGQHESTAKSPNPDYLNIRAPTPSHLSPGLLVSHLRNSIATHFGDCGLGLTTGSLKVIYLAPATSTAIIRCPRQHFRIVWASLTYMTDLPGVRRGEAGKRCVVQVVRVSGTIRKSEEELLRRAKQDLVRAKAAEDGVGSAIFGRLSGPSAPTSARTVDQIEENIMDVHDEDEDEAENVSD